MRHALPIRSIFDSYSVVALVRRAAETVGFDATGRGSAAIAAGELATNIVRHAWEGRVRIYTGPDFLKIVAEDRGPGISNLERAMGDGYSEGRLLGPDDRRCGGIGCGLGAVQRLMDRLQVESEPGVGTCVVAIRWRTRNRRA